MKPKRKTRKAKTRRVVRVKTASRVATRVPLVPLTYEKPYGVNDPEDDLRF